MQVVADTAVAVTLEEVAHCVLTQVEVEDNHALVSVDVALGQVSRDERLSGALVELSESDNLLVGRLLLNPRQIVANHTHGLSHRACAVAGRIVVVLVVG